MGAANKPDRGRVELSAEECKGCGLCVEACPPRVLFVSEAFNHYGLHPAACKPGCTGCGICFYVCPEPGAITVLRYASSKFKVQSSTSAPVNLEL